MHVECSNADFTTACDTNVVHLAKFKLSLTLIFEQQKHFPRYVWLFRYASIKINLNVSVNFEMPSFRVFRKGVCKKTAKNIILVNKSISSKCNVDTFLSLFDANMLQIFMT